MRSSRRGVPPPAKKSPAHHGWRRLLRSGRVAMNDSTKRQFQEADAAADKAIAAFIGKIESMSGKWDAVAPAYILERVLLGLCDEMTKLIDDPDLANSMEPALVKLSNALADFRDSRWEDRER